MTRKTLFHLLAMLTLMLALGGGVLLAGRVQAQGPGPQNGDTAQAAVGTAFTYQGRLTDTAGSPIAGPCDFQFTLYDAASGGNVVGSTQTKTNVSLNNGYFSVELDFGATAFQGEARWMAVSVACPTGGSYTPLTGRVALTAAPYAHSLRPGATVSSAATSGGVFRAIASATSGNPAALYGEAFSPSGYGVYATNKAPGSGFEEPTAIYGEVNAANGFALYGYNAAGRGIAGQGTGRYGVGGFSDTSYGVFGKSTSGYGIYSDGKAHINGNLTWSAKTSYVSVSAAAFGPVDESYMYTNWGGTLDPKNLASRYYYAPVQLPHGATVTRIKFYWSDLSGDYNGQCYLYRNYFAPGGDTLGTVDTSGASGTGWSETTAITSPTVDNSQYAYYVGWDLRGGGDVEGYGVVIEYTITGPY